MIKLSRAQLLGRRPGMDVTVKSAKGLARRFAPTWAMVMGLKRGQISEAQYASEYLAILEGLTDETWDWLRNEAERNAGTMTFLCYCRDGAFCHTVLLIDYLVGRWPTLYTR